REIERAFDLRRGPLLRAVLYRLSELEHVLVVTAHHVVVDGWSMPIIVQEATALYRARVDGRARVNGSTRNDGRPRVNGETASLPTSPARYVDYVRRQRSQLTPDVI